MDYLAFHFLNRYRETGILTLRVGIGLMFMMHGFPKLAGGPDAWGKLGGAMSNVGMGFAPVFWGFMGAFSEGIGGLMLVIGFLVRPACFLMFITMVIASTVHLHKDGTLLAASHPIEMAIVFLSLIFIGAGKYSLDRLLWPRHYANVPTSPKGSA